MKLDFLINRLMRMSLNEIVYRVKQKVNNEYESRAYKSYKLNTAVIKDDCKLFQGNPAIENKDEIITKADKLCKGIMDI
ncbi:MAG: hypothetical protein GX660_04580, partial [Clostridiaceae bacterium]|nr:hypothetical protein [Clostridiaceae bacterium]